MSRQCDARRVRGMQNIRSAVRSTKGSTFQSSAPLVKPSLGGGSRCCVGLIACDNKGMDIIHRHANGIQDDAMLFLHEPTTPPPSDTPSQQRTAGVTCHGHHPRPKAHPWAPAPSSRSAHPPTGSAAWSPPRSPHGRPAHAADRQLPWT